jgi:NAD(P)-dependent dehydrogenase (short-subunit alcohol dehydrogenase family)
LKIELNGKTAIVTGSTAGIGYAIAKGLAESGASVVINGRTEQRVAEALKNLKTEVSGAEIKGIAADLGTAAGAAELVQQIPQADILVNNMGKTFEQIEKDFIQNLRPSSLLKRFATIEEVANMVVYVASEQASATSGAALRVDGGVVRAIL